VNSFSVNLDISQQITIISFPRDCQHYSSYKRVDEKHELCLVVKAFN